MASECPAKTVRQQDPSRSPELLKGHSSPLFFVPHRAVSTVLLLSNSFSYLSVLEHKTFMVQVFKNWYNTVCASSDALYFNL